MTEITVRAQGGPDCVLCRALANGQLGRPPRVENTVLGESEHFILLPAVGPIVAGHVLLTSREHIPSLAAMSREAKAEYERIVAGMLRLDWIRGDLLEAEHGATHTSSGGGCVVHAHVNLIPGLGFLSEHFEEALGTAMVAPTLHNINAEIAYIFVRASQRDILVHGSEQAPSQAIRRVVCGFLSQMNWNWRLDRRVDLIERTVDLWARALPERSLAALP